MSPSHSDARYEQSVRLCAHCESSNGGGIADAGDLACSVCGRHDAPHRYVRTDDDAIERAHEALCRFLFPGYCVPRAEMVRAVIDALDGSGDWRAKLPAMRAAVGDGSEARRVA